MYTGKEIFDISISIMDELSENGTVSDNYVREYKNRAPALLISGKRKDREFLRHFR